MDDAIKIWLQKKRMCEAPACLAGGLASLLAGIIVVALTGYLCFFLFYLGWFGIAAAWDLVSGQQLPRWPSTGIGIFTAVFVVLLFIGNARSRWWDVGDIPRGAWPRRARKDDAEQFASLVASAKFVTDIFFTGPRLITASWRACRKAFRLWNLDLDACSDLLQVLLAAGRAVSREELAGRLANCDLPELERQIRNIEGVIFLNDGLTLTGELRSELANVYAFP